MLCSLQPCFASPVRTPHVLPTLFTTSTGIHCNSQRRPQPARATTATHNSLGRQLQTCTTHSNIPQDLIVALQVKHPRTGQQTPWTNSTTLDQPKGHLNQFPMDPWKKGLNTTIPGIYQKVHAWPLIQRSTPFQALPAPQGSTPRFSYVSMSHSQSLGVDDTGVGSLKKMSRCTPLCKQNKHFRHFPSHPQNLQTGSP